MKDLSKLPDNLPVPVDITNGMIRKVFYPVFPPNKNADDVISWFREGGA
jgi:hypothetical protein